MNRAKILVINDEKTDFELLKKSIKDCNADFRWNRNGETFAFDYDIYLIDEGIHKKVCTVELARQIQKEDSEAIVFIYSSKMNDPDVLKKLLNLSPILFFISDEFMCPNSVIVPCKDFFMEPPAAFPTWINNPR